MSIEFHEAANIFPLLDGKEYKDFKANIKANGLLEPIVLYEGKILDGRNRYRACKELGIEPLFKEYSGNGIYSYVVSVNIHRRNLSSDQRACCAVEAGILEELEEEAKERQGMRSDLAKNFSECSETNEARNILAEMFGTNSQYISYAKRLKSLNPEVFQEVKAGKRKLYKAMQDAENAEMSSVLDGVDLETAVMKGERELMKNVVFAAIRSAAEGNDADKAWLIDETDDFFGCRMICEGVGMNHNMILDWADNGFTTTPMHEVIIRVLDRQFEGDS